MAFAETLAGGLGSQYNPKNFVDSLANKFVLKPKGVSGIGGFIFDYEGDTRVQIHTESTDHYVEDNTAVQDHAAVRPIKLTLHGFVSELVQAKPSGLLAAISSVQDKLTTVTAYTGITRGTQGKYTPQALNKVQAALTQVQSVTNTVDQALQRVGNLVQMFPGMKPTKTAQQLAYARLQAIALGRQLILVETPYTIFDNMIIESLTFTQPAETKFWSDISVVVKQIRFAGTSATPSLLSRFSVRAAAGRAAAVNAGNAAKKAEDVSLLYQGAHSAFPSFAP